MCICGVTVTEQRNIFQTRQGKYVQLRSSTLYSEGKSGWLYLNHIWDRNQFCWLEITV